MVPIIHATGSRKRLLCQTRLLSQKVGYRPIRKIQ